MPFLPRNCDWNPTQTNPNRDNEIATLLKLFYSVALQKHIFLLLGSIEENQYIPSVYLIKYLRYNMGSRKKTVLFLVSRPIRPLPPLLAQWPQELQKRPPYNFFCCFFQWIGGMGLTPPQRTLLLIIEFYFDMLPNLHCILVCEIYSGMAIDADKCGLLCLYIYPQIKYTQMDHVSC